MKYTQDSENNNFFLIYANILLFESFKKIKMYKDNNDDVIYEWKKFLTRYSSFLQEITDSQYKLTSYQKIRISDAYYSNHFIIENNEITNIISCKHWNIKDYENCPDNSYSFALSFNKEIIKNLKEKSALTFGYLQLNGYILTNYLLNEPM